MPRESGPIKEAGSGDGRPRHGTAPLPLDRAILWTPRGAAGRGGRASFRGYPVFIEYDVLAGVNRHLDQQEREPRFGFLLGRLFHCPEHDVDYAVCDTAVAAREVLSEEGSGAFLVRAWSEAQAVFSGHSGLLLGWYHSHYRFGPMPSDADIETNARYFDAPWQLSIVVVPDRARPLGGVFRHSAATGEAAPVRPSAFYEILPVPHGGDIGGATSAVSWANYEAHRPLPPLVEPIGVPEGPESVEARRGAGSGQRLALWEDDEEVPGGPGPGIGRSGAFPPGEDRPTAVPLVIPGETAETSLLPPRSRRVSWPVIVAGVTLGAAALFLLLSDGPRRPTTARPDTPPAQGGRVTPEMRSLLEEVEALEIAGERYGERASDFEAGRIGCDLLTTGYVAADEAYVRIATRYRELAARANPRAAAAYERAGEEMAEVNRHFDSSECPRP